MTEGGKSFSGLGQPVAGEDKRSGGAGVRLGDSEQPDSLTGDSIGAGLGQGGVAPLPDHVTRDSTGGTGLGDVGPPPPHHVTGWLDVITEHINNHLRGYRMGAWVVGSVGVVLLLRFSRVPLRRFRQVSDIPVDYVLANRTISGVVAATKWNSIGVWHVPAWRRVLRYEMESPSE